MNDRKHPDALCLLMVGNSFADDAMTDAYAIARAAGVREVQIGNLYIGGCSIEHHLACAQSNEPVYDFCYFDEKGEKQKRPATRFSEGVAFADWTAYSLQQASHFSGMRETYAPLRALHDATEALAPLPGQPFYFHMTWAYQQNSTHGGFANYGGSQAAMYRAIVDCTRHEAMTSGLFCGIIPCGTAVQNLRTSFLGDTICRDGYHLDLRYGRYVAGLTLVGTMTGIDPLCLGYRPPDVSEREALACRRAAAAAIRAPFTVTQTEA